MSVTMYIESGTAFSIDDLRDSLPNCHAIRQYDKLLAAAIDVLNDDSRFVSLKEQRKRHNQRMSALLDAIPQSERGRLQDSDEPAEGGQ